MTQPTLTPRQMQIIQMIRRSRIEKGYSPTMQEMADEMEVSKVTVFEHVEAIIKKGLLHRKPLVARSLVLVEGIFDDMPDDPRALAAAEAKLREAWKLISKLNNIFVVGDLAAEVWLRENQQFAPEGAKVP